jgi:dCTP diphosphatase
MPGRESGRAFLFYATGHNTKVDTPKDRMDAALESLREQLRRFAADRDWNQFHSPKNLASALTVEAAELLEHFQWLTEEQSGNLAPQARHAVAQELADVFLYLLQLADKLDVDLVTAAQDKLALNARKYPVERSRGHSRKYNQD